MITSIIQALFKIKIQPNMREQEKKREKIYEKIFTLKPSQSFFLSIVYKAKKFFNKKKSFYGKEGVED